jgi:hypothetical protein
MAMADMAAGVISIVIMKLTVTLMNAATAVAITKSLTVEATVEENTMTKVTAAIVI